VPRRRINDTELICRRARVTDGDGYASTKRPTVLDMQMLRGFKRDWLSIPPMLGLAVVVRRIFRSGRLGLGQATAAGRTGAATTARKQDVPSWCKP
jgi:hypothetical protein